MSAIETTPLTNEDTGSITSSQKRALSAEQKAKMAAGLAAHKAKLAAMSSDEKAAYKAEKAAEKEAKALKKAERESAKAAKEAAKEANKESKPKRELSPEQKAKMAAGAAAYRAKLAAMTPEEREALKESKPKKEKKIQKTEQIEIKNEPKTPEMKPKQEPVCPDAPIKAPRKFLEIDGENRYWFDFSVEMVGAEDDEFTISNQAKFIEAKQEETKEKLIARWFKGFMLTSTKMTNFKLKHMEGDMWRGTFEMSDKMYDDDMHAELQDLTDPDKFGDYPLNFDGFTYNLRGELRDYAQIVQ